MLCERVIFLVVLLASALGANILYVSPMASPSHHIWNKALAFGLVKNGHNLTMLSHDSEKGPVPKNFTLIVMEEIYTIMHELFDMNELAEETVLGGIVVMYNYGEFACKFDYNTTGFKTLLNYPEDYKFDLMIIDNSVGRCFYPLIEGFQNPPVVAVTPFLLPPVLGKAFGKHIYTSYSPYYSTKYTNKMSLSERALNFFYTYAEIYYRDYIFLPRETAIIRERFPALEHTVDQLERNISLLLCNTDPVMEDPEALSPNVIPVGGLHARPPQALPKDLKKIADEAKDGIILISLGTNVRSDQLDLKVRKAFFDSFAKFPQTVFWKFETDAVEGVPKNVIIRKWLPQNDILGHPNTKLFISHGGALSSQEAMYHGVPVVGIPFFADQHGNVRKMVDKKIAKHLDKDELTYENIYGAVKEVLTNTMYRDNIRDLSRKYRDQPQTALEKSIFWIEYVLRHGGAEHLVPMTRDMPTYQIANLDVLAVFAVGLYLFYSLLSLVYTMLRFLFTSKLSSAKHKSTK